ncbi:restriction endonuclease subunit S [Campylobacter helveticus]|uniref:restriction endonuclease subunit S n=1 Tax=Campylobacter helveticus TaxID=28898 RepID=UPI0022EADBC4|nr:restriction endonuclease subunit S [Campylobacter helveticus]
MRVYKPSGIEWIEGGGGGKIPAHWEVKRLRHIFKEVSIKKCGNEQQLCATQSYGVIPKKLYSYKTVEVISGDLNSFKLVKKDNFVISLRSFEGGIEHSNYQGIISPAYTILEPQVEIYSFYFKFLFKSSFFISTLNIHKIGIREGQNISYASLQYTPIPLPPLQEQKEIAEFLDSKCEKIQNYIDKKQKLITLLQEKKQALINEAVTKGLNPNIESKNSGIEYLGLIPHHWEVVKVKYIATLRNQKSNDSDFKVGLENIESQTGKYISTNEVVFEDSGIYFYKNDILFGKLRPYLAKVFLADREGVCVSEFLVLTPKKQCGIFLKFLMLSPLFISVVDGSTYGSKMPRASWEFIGNLKIPLPPLQEQKEIAAFLDSKVAQIDSAIEKTKKQIELVKEYKNTLINEAVCGRINLERK